MELTENFITKDSKLDENLKHILKKDSASTNLDTLKIMNIDTKANYFLSTPGK